MPLFANRIRQSTAWILHNMVIRSADALERFSPRGPFRCQTTELRHGAVVREAVKKIERRGLRHTTKKKWRPRDATFRDTVTKTFGPLPPRSPPSTLRSAFNTFTADPTDEPSAKRRRPY